MKKKLLRYAAVCLLLLGMNSVSSAYVIDFETDTLGNKSNNWSSNGSPLVTFSDSNGSDLIVDNWGYQSDGIGLAVFSDYDDSWLIMDFVMDMNYLSFEFGNDDPYWTDPGAMAVLILYDNSSQIAQVNVELNRDDIMNQAISYSGLNFDYATFYYDVAPRVGLIEVVDNIEFTAAQVPEPSTLLLFGSGLVGLGFFGRRRKV